ncbi:FGGY family carbohydrate kinase [Novisyntrophococcus fermenticellae]|uniref:FGGY family carbohydrate kinase n=1 Tax=Novisyntrophococcus fermenticellae TaxID=2068655 RepID=UPI001E4DDE86|nr:FGGY family carbohydrate kinase [Novisyntrophococcus fermenticellae]
MKKCAKAGKIPESVGIDTWEVDYVLLDKEGRKLAQSTAYRDSRTERMDEEVFCFLSEAELYKRTGIQKQLFNTIYQLMALKQKEQELMKQASKLLLIPDYLHYILTGIMATEYTNATTTQLVSPVTKDWDWELIRTLGYPSRLFAGIRQPGYRLGSLLADIAEEVGFHCQIILPATHDRASAVMAVPATRKNTVYISSGTWSLMGTELPEADCFGKSRRKNFTNEGGYDCRFRYLKILWNSG